MDTLKIIEKLAKTAQKEEIPQMDVSRAVMARIDTAQQDSAVILSFEWFAGISAAAASIVILISIPAWRYLFDPLAQILAPLQEVMLW
ncbi:MAG: hypothetical protein JW806_08510 [Sedimentisphaerales bacterium]|nr:hypothetical protein [Sedimentisphaerales bacterium]